MPTKDHNKIKIGTVLTDADNDIHVTIDDIQLIQRRGKMQKKYITKQGFIYTENLKNWHIVKE